MRRASPSPLASSSASTTTTSRCSRASTASISSSGAPADAPIVAAIASITSAIVRPLAQTATSMLPCGGTVSAGRPATPSSRRSPRSAKATTRPRTADLPDPGSPVTTHSPPRSVPSHATNSRKARVRPREIPAPLTLARHPPTTRPEMLLDPAPPPPRPRPPGLRLLGHRQPHHHDRDHQREHPEHDPQPPGRTRLAAQRRRERRPGHDHRPHRGGHRARPAHAQPTTKASCHAPTPSGRPARLRIRAFSQPQRGLRSRRGWVRRRARGAR